MSDSVDREFSSFDLDDRLLCAVEALGFKHPTPIQAAAIPVLMTGKSIIGRARTGSGKTAAFGLPLLDRVIGGTKGPPRGLVLTPTRELAIQVSGALKELSGEARVRILPIYGGAPYGPQLKRLRSGVDVVVGTPGRVLDHIDRGTLDLSQVEIFVLDEADEMLRMGFIDAIDRVFEVLPDERQVALFSATMPSRIRQIAKKRISKHVVVQVEDTALTTDHITQRYAVIPRRHKLEALVRILQAEPLGTTLIFANTRRDCASIADSLVRFGFAADALHGDMAQSARERVLTGLRSGRLQLVVATDVAARGIDVEHITHVVNMELPTNTESYVHRIGRTARAGRSGTAITLVVPPKRRKLQYMQRDLGVKSEAMPIPTDQDIAAIQRRDLWGELATSMEQPDFEDVKTWLDGLLDGSDEDSREIAAAAIAIIARQRVIRLDDNPGKKVPGWMLQNGGDDHSDAPPRKKHRGKNRSFRPRKNRNQSGPRRSRTRKFRRR